jgi:hypothetical protein
MIKEGSEWGDPFAMVDVAEYAFDKGDHAQAAALFQRAAATGFARAQVRVVCASVLL